MPSICSLFSGIGGIDLGFEQARFEVAWANEMDAAACKTYRHNFPNTPLVEVSRFLLRGFKKVSKIEMVICFLKSHVLLIRNALKWCSWKMFRILLSTITEKLFS